MPYRVNILFCLSFRISLGITMTFLGLEARTDLPKVSYPTALVFFVVFLFFLFIFATILQFAFVHFYTKYHSGECYYNYYETSSESESDDNEVMTYFPQSSAMSTTSHVSSMSQIEKADMYGGVIQLSALDIELDDNRSIRAFKNFRKFIRKYILCLSYFEKEDTQSQNYGSQVSINNSANESEQRSEVSTYIQNTLWVDSVSLKQQVQKSSFTEIPKTIYSHTIKIGVNMNNNRLFILKNFSGLGYQGFQWTVSRYKMVHTLV